SFQNGVLIPGSLRELQLAVRTLRNHHARLHDDVRISREKLSAIGALDSRSVYAALERMGLIYGPAFQSITAIRRGNGEALARLRLPASVAHTLGDYVLHPSLLDGALQAGVGLLDDLSSPSPETRLPFALESLRIAAPCTPSMTVWVRPSFGSRIDDPIVKLDIDLCDEAGNVCAEVRGFASRAMSVPVTATAAPAKTADVLYAAPVWQSSKIAASGATELAEHHVVLCELEVERLESLLPRSLCIRLPAERDENIAQRYSACALACFERIQAILRGRPTGDVLLQIVVADDGEHALFTGLSALLKTAAAENPRFAGQVIVTRGDVSAEELAHHLEEETRSRDPLVRYREGGREVLQWQEVAAQASAPPAPFLDNGVYLITGGLGGLGLLFAKEIIEQTRDARVVLTGRAEAGDKTRAELDGSWTHGRVTYRQLDLGDAGQVRDVVGAIRDEHGRLDGILHSAGMLADRFILKKSGAEFANVLAPKVAGTFHLDQATRDIELDFFVLFSSVAGATGNPGQADYATANAFMDCYAAHRNELVAARQRYGRTLSINWPLWQSGGMRLDDTTRELLHQTTGMRPMQTPVGLQAFRRCLTLPHDQMLVVEGDVARIRRTLFGDRDVPVARREEPVAVAAEGLVERTQEYLRREFADLLKLPFQKIDPQAALEKYGIDSILAMRLTNQLEKTFGTLSKTLFFEYQTIAALAGYLIAAHPVVLRDKLGLLDDLAGARVAPPAVVEPLPSEPRRRRKRFLPAGEARNEIAIVGLAGRYPQAENLAEFWRNLQAGRDCITEIPLERWDHALYFDADRDKYGKSYSKWGGFISDVDKFDPLFFNISPKEAELIDPQERLFLQTAWETIEDAGYTKESISGRRVGVFVGVMWGQYELFGAESLLSGNPVFPGSSHGSIANRVSYFFDFHGPSIALDTMCSSSLTAIHLACEELRRGEIEAAIAGGVNVTVHPYKYLGLSQGKFASSDGRCRSFGAGGDGYVPGEGVGAVLLKPLEAALRDGDQIHAVIRSSTVNHGGKTNGYTVPNPIAQGDLIREALRKANVDPRTLSYIETHGTGTSLGDPIEIAGLSRAFQGSTEDKQFCPIGSVKSNIGHLESAAGIAAVTKALLQIRHRQLVPSLHSEPLNPHIDFTESPFYVQTELADWARPAAHPRRVGVSSFGAGGSNAHLILEELDACETATEGATTREVFVLSARTPDALRRYAERVARFLENAAEVSLASVAYTSQVGRTPMDARLAVIASSMEELREKLNAFLRGSGPESEGVFQRNLKETEYDAADLIAGPAGKAFLDALLSHRELEKIARLWVLGADVDWSVMERQGRPRRVSLPTYPFEKERCWIRQEAPLLRVAPERAQQEISVLRQPAAEQKRRIAYSPQWTPEPLVAQGETRPVSEPLLMFDPSGELWQEMAAQAPGADSIVLVQYGAAFEELAPNRYVLDPEREEQFQALLDALRARALLPGRIIHCAAEIASLDVPHEVARHLSGGAYLLFHLCRALMREAQRKPVRIVSVFSGDSEAADPLGAATAGFLKTLTLEDPTVVAKAIETDRALSLAEKAALLWDELADRDWTAQEIRYRRVQGTEQVTRSVRTLARAEVPAEVGALPLRERGVYLITGGLGALGLVFAEYLAKNYQARLILTGRTAPNATQEQRLEQMKAGGAEVVFVQADVASRTDAERVVRETKSRFSAINGVIHAAGVNRDALLRRKTREEMDAVLAPKV
ncbi:MAG: SDR family NAD(P)-dependent oxidoreductase, partial [Thermoanaerobaculia bacterium]